MDQLVESTKTLIKSINPNEASGTSYLTSAGDI